MKYHAKSSLYNLSNLTIKKCVLFESQAEGFYFILFCLFFEGGSHFCFVWEWKNNLKNELTFFCYQLQVKVNAHIF